MRWSDRMSLWLAGGLATFVNLVVNVVVWEGLFIWHKAFRVGLLQLGFQLSLVPVIFSIIILMATMALTRRQMQTAEAQTATLEAIHALFQRQTQQDKRIEELLRKIDVREAGDASAIDVIRQFVESVGPDFPLKLATMMQSHHRLNAMMDEYDARQKEQDNSHGDAVADYGGRQERVD